MAKAMDVLRKLGLFGGKAPEGDDPRQPGHRVQRAGELGEYAAREKAASPLELGNSSVANTSSIRAKAASKEVCSWMLNPLRSDCTRSSNALRSARRPAAKLW